MKRRANYFLPVSRFSPYVLTLLLQLHTLLMLTVPSFIHHQLIHTRTISKFQTEWKQMNFANNEIKHHTYINTYTIKCKKKKQKKR